MKKLISALSALMLMTSPLSAYADTAITDSSAEKKGETQITMEVAPAYTVVIPADIKIEEGATNTYFGDYYLEKGVLEPGYYVNVAIDGYFEMEHSLDDSEILPYDIVSSDSLVVENGENGYFSYKDYSVNIRRIDNHMPMYILIDEADWENSAAGSYSDTVTFYITYQQPKDESN